MGFRHDAWLATCDKFEGVKGGALAVPACTSDQMSFFKSLGEEMGFTDFNPETVNWASPVKWRNSGNCDMDDQSGCLISLGGGFAIVCGFGVGFTLLTLLLNFLEQKVTGSKQTSEEFNTAGRNIKIGLTGSVIVSQWTWAATLLQSSNKAWQQGISGPFWYAAGATIQVLLFGILAIEVKRKCPNAHTFLEIIDARWGKAAHLTFLCFAFFTNFLVTGMLLLGGAAVINAASGMDARLCSFLMPWGVVFYTLVGGLKATFLAGYIHTSIIMVGLCVFVTAVYTLEGDILGGPSGSSCVNTEQCNAIGSAGSMWERLSFIIELGESAATNSGFYAQSALSPPSPPPMPPSAPDWAWGQIANCSADGLRIGPVAANKGGSYLTMMSTGGLIFGVINTVGNFGTVFVDQSYWQSAIAASPASAHKGYMLGGLVWFAIPFALATSLGLAAVAMNVELSSNDANAGLVPPAAATVLMGQGGGVLTIVMLFMAITSTGSAECIAVSSLVTYDVYRKYFNPTASGAEILKVSKIFVGIFGATMGIVAVIFNSIEIELLDWDANARTWSPPCGGGKTTLSMGWVYVFMGNMIGSAVPPVALSILWADCTGTAAIAGAWGGLFASMASWMICAANMFEEVNYWSLFQDIPLLVGNLVAILFSLLLCVVISKVQGGQKYDWSTMNQKIQRVEDDKDDIPDWELSQEFLESARKWSIKVGLGLTFFLTIIWPIFISFPLGVFPKGTWAIWTAVSFTWGWVGMLVIVGLPLYENWDLIKGVFTMDFAKVPSAEPREVEITTTTS